MIDKDRVREAKQNFAHYLQDGLIKRGNNEAAKAMYIQNATLSLNLAEECWAAA
ncbi:MAG: hypothetical protein AABY09_01355 [Nanoarchaeota archaeon]